MLHKAWWLKHILVYEHIPYVYMYISMHMLTDVRCSCISRRQYTYAWRTDHTSKYGYIPHNHMPLKSYYIWFALYLLDCGETHTVGEPLVYFCYAVLNFPFSKKNQQHKSTNNTSTPSRYLLSKMVSLVSIYDVIFVLFLF